MSIEREQFAVGSGHAAAAAPGRCPSTSVLLVGDSGTNGARLQRRLASRLGYVEIAADVGCAERLLPRCHFDYIVVDVERLDSPLLGWASGIRSQQRVIVAADPSQPEITQSALRAGAVDVIARPLDPDELVVVIGRHSTPDRAATRFGRARQAFDPRDRVLVGSSECITAVRRLVDRVAALPATVLIEGETGTGKELVARMLHEQSGRPGPFVPVNCGAIAPELIESEIFGHAKGAFTGAHRVREGLFVSARGGTLFLDEISEMRADLQVKVLRALEEHRVRPVGSDHEVTVDVRIIASSQPDLHSRVEAGAFREDLFYRLNVIHIRLPPLRERPGDVAVLADHFVRMAAFDYGLPAQPLADAEVRWLESRPWRGNVRELRHVIERKALLGELSDAAGVQLDSTRAEDPAYYPLDWTLEQVKEDHMLRVLEASAGNRSAAARKLGVSRKTLERKFGPAGANGDWDPVEGTWRGDSDGSSRHR